MKRILSLAYAVFAYATFFGVFLYAIAFLGNFAVSPTLDSAPQMSWQAAVGINLLLLAAFSVQHSLMARPFFKKWLTQWLPEHLERSTYVLASNVAMILLFAFWQPIGGTVWELTHPVAVGAAYTLYGLGWIVLFASTCMLSHWDLFGLRQAWLAYRGQPYTPLPFREPLLYKHMRHPIYVGWLIIFWAAPVMTAAHLLFAVGCTAYILIAIRWEERDLSDAIPEYAEYQKRVPMLIPQRKVERATPPARIAENREQAAVLSP